MPYSHASTRSPPRVISGAYAEQERIDVVGLVVIAVLGAALSVAVTGYVFGTSNNLFHLPIIGRFYDEPQFRTDPFIQSLRFYAAGPFLLLQGADRYVDPAQLFFVLHYLARVVAFVGFLMCAGLLGVTSRRDRAVFAVLLTFITLMQGSSFAGGGGLFTSTFSQSDYANGLSLIVIYFAAKGRLTESFAVNGVIFFINAFAAVWNAAPLAAIICLLLVQRRIMPAQVLKRGSIGLVIFLVLASPIVANVLSNPGFGRPTPFDYQTFLVEYWPFHFLSQWNSLHEKLSLLAVVATGLLAFHGIGRRADVFQAAMVGFMGLYGIGIVVPSLTNSPAILNLHLLRSGVEMQILSSLGSLVLATCWQTSGKPADSRVFGPLLIVALCTLRAARFLAPLVIAASLIPRIARLCPPFVLRGRPMTQIALAIVLLCAWPYGVWQTVQGNAELKGRVTQWAAVGAWAEKNTPADAVFLVPMVNLRDSALFLKVSDEPDEPWQGSEIFDYASHRRVWVDFKRGAAVMWTPSYYPIWHTRIQDVLRLKTLDQKLAYAAAHGIGYVVASCLQDDGQPTVFRTQDLCVFDVTANPAARNSTAKG